jgi:hypothetical protein
MLNPIITPPRVPLVDPNTGLINRAWYLFFVSLNNVANDVVNDPVVSPSAESLIASYDAVLQTLTQEVQTQPSFGDMVSQMAEMQKQIDALSLVPSQVVGLLSQLADVNALNPSDGDKLIYDGTLGKWKQDSRSYLMLE